MTHEVNWVTDVFTFDLRLKYRIRNYGNLIRSILLSFAHQFHIKMLYVRWNLGYTLKISCVSLLYFMVYTKIFINLSWCPSFLHVYWVPIFTSVSCASHPADVAVVSVYALQLLLVTFRQTFVRYVGQESAFILFWKFRHCIAISIPSRRLMCSRALVPVPQP
jgi:hypothetical protein